MDKIAILKSKITSSYLPDQIEGLDDIRSLMEEIAALTIQTLETAPDRLFIAERIFNINNVFAEKLNACYDKTSDEDLKLHIALVLYNKNEHALKFRQFLLHLLAGNDWGKAEAALLKLSQTNTTEAGPIIINMLRTVSLNEVDKVTMLVEGLKKVSGVMPDDVFQRLSADDVAWQIKTLLHSK